MNEPGIPERREIESQNAVGEGAERLIETMLQRPQGREKFKPWDEERVITEVDDALGEATAEDRERARRLIRRLLAEYNPELSYLEGCKTRLMADLASSMKKERYAFDLRQRQEWENRAMQAFLRDQRAFFAVDDFANAAVSLAQELDRLKVEHKKLKDELAALQSKESTP